MFRVVSATALCLLLFGAGTVPAVAHADFIASDPASGSVTKRAPSQILLRFSESVQVNTVKILGGNTRELASRHVTIGNRVVVTPVAKLPMGTYAVTWSVVSEDGHVVNGTTTFGLRIGSTPGRTVGLTTTPSSAMTLSGSRPGQLVLRNSQKVTGEAAWLHPALLGPVVWAFEGRTASGVLPFPGTWSLNAEVLRGPALIAYRGSVVLS